MKSAVPPVEGAIDYTNLVATARAHAAHRRTLPLTLPDGKRAWLKLALDAEVNNWHRLQSLLARLCQNPFLLPTVAAEGVASLKGEIRRVRKLAACGFPVPHILATGEDWLLLADSGLPSITVLRSEDYPREQRLQQLQAIALLMAHMHQRGCWHGRPALKDFLCKKQTVTLCDFEEDVRLHLSKLECLVRDALIFGHSLFRVFARTDLEMARYGLAVYWQAAPASVKNAILDKVAAMDVLMGFDVFFGKYLGGDAKAMFLCLREFNEMAPSKVI